MKLQILALLALAFAAPALAATATVTRVDGRVLVNQGDQFVPAQAGQVVSTGDRVMVPAGGGSSLSFDDGCGAELPADSLVTIPDRSPCAGGNLVTQRVSPQGPAATKVGTRPYAADNWWAWIAGATAFALVVAESEDEDDDETASP